MLDSRSTGMFRETPFCAVIIVVIHGLLLISGACSNGWFHMERFQLPCGILAWQTGDFQPMLVNPPLVRLWAALPLLNSVNLSHSGGASTNSLARQEGRIAADFFQIVGKDHLQKLRRSRFFSIPLSLIGIVVAYRWSKQLFGYRAGLLCAWIYCCSPQMIGHGQLIPFDVAAASFGVLAMYLVWCWLQNPTWDRAIIAGAGVGLAMLTKLTWAILIGVVPACAFGFAFGSRLSIPKLGRQLISLLIVAIYVVNLAYWFQGTGYPLGEFQFHAPMFTGVSANEDIQPSGNRFTNTWLERMPVPFPAPYLKGIDVQKWDMQRERQSYLRGEWRRGGWIYFYLYALLIKEPVGTWILCLMSGYFGFRKWIKNRSNPFTDVCVWGPGFAVFALVAAELSLNLHVRYIIPALPFWFIGISSVATSCHGRRWLGIIVLACCSQMIASSVWCHPHCISYFNELVGGPHQGIGHLTSSSIHWAQDDVYVDCWQNQHQGVKLSQFKSGRLYQRESGGALGPEVSFEPGWYLIEINEFSRPGRVINWFSRQPITEFAGYGFRLYFITDRQLQQLQQLQRSWS
jgi:hypothetical protein